MQNTVHFVLQAKGGIGKSFVSTLLAQHLINETGAVRCFDTDQENTTFAHYAALSVQHVVVTGESRLIDPKKFDSLMETLLSENRAGRFSQAEELAKDKLALVRLLELWQTFWRDVLREVSRFSTRGLEA